MKISIENFKSIKRLRNFEIKPLTIISGTNSSGKSSFIQLLLLLKQTVELDSSKEALYLKGPLYKVRAYEDVAHNKDLTNMLGIGFEFDKSEISKINTGKIALLNNLGDYKCFVSIQYNDKKAVKKFSVDFKFTKSEIKDQSILFTSDEDQSFKIETNTAIFGNELLYEEPQVTNIEYSSIYPKFYESLVEGKDDIGMAKDVSTDRYSRTPIYIDGVKNIINSFLQNISYIGPIREEPKEEYFIPENHKNVGIKGEFVSQVLEEFATVSYSFFKIDENDNGLSYKNVDALLLDWVKYWMCEVFELATDIRTEKKEDAYRIVLINKSGLATSIKHVGVGVSQLLPIVVQGLIMPENSTLIVEQPEVHLHPKVQSQLYDFLYGLTLQGKRVIVETHSSHFITRMRRRIAEDETNEMDDRISLTFIEDNIFRTIEMNDLGTLEYYPENFIESSNKELRAIVKAQVKKRTKNDT